MSNLASMARPRKLGPRSNLAKPTKTKKQKQRPPIKVVYISNPMRVKTSASQFRALVQQLTGQDSEIPADPTVYEDGDADKLVVGEEDVDIQRRSDEQLCGRRESCLASSQPPERSSSTTTTVTTSSSSEAEELGGGACYYGGDDFLMLDNLLPVWGSEAFLCTWMC